MLSVSLNKTFLSLFSVGGIWKKKCGGISNQNESYFYLFIYFVLELKGAILVDMVIFYFIFHMKTNICLGSVSNDAPQNICI